MDSIEIIEFSSEKRTIEEKTSAKYLSESWKILSAFEKAVDGID